MDANKRSDMDNKWKKLATRAVTQEEFKAQLVADPVARMSEFGLHPPEGAKVRAGADKAVHILPPTGSSPEIKEEIKWWNLRLDTIRQFGKEEKEATSHGAPFEDGEV
ncbi:MAG: hypothetical protein ACE5G9_08885 [Nitrospinales bacterium]